MRTSLALSALGLAAFLTYGARAFAQEPLGIEPPTPSPPAAGGSEQAVVARYWGLGRPRLFFSALLDNGYAYVKPQLAVGYGRPYWHWVGLHTYPLVSLGGIGHYAGIAGEIPGLQLRGGARYYYPFSRSFLLPDDSFSRREIENLQGPKADYLALEAEAVTTIRVPVGSLFAVGTFCRTFLVPDGYFQYEESLRAVMKPPYIWRARLGYLVAFGRDAAIRLGPAADVIGLPGRGEFVLRGGVLASVSINAFLEAQASFIPVILSPDTLGSAGGDFGQLGMRYRWATGSTPDPEALNKARVERIEELKKERVPVKR
jgi:hypothetical protein